jgi:hypothetical protein
MRLPAVETEVYTGTRNPLQFYLTGSNYNYYQIWFGLNLPGDYPIIYLKLHYLHLLLKVHKLQDIEKNRQMKKISVLLRQLVKLQTITETTIVEIIFIKASNSGKIKIAI